MWNETDIQRVAHLFKMKVSTFLDAYLVQDSDGDWVYPAAPCPFLTPQDNTCQIYDHRPKACKEYPHTNRKNMMGILQLTAKNVLICPAVGQIMEKLEQVYLSSK
jgi:Fe-S-cluster containining protein